MSRRLWGLVLAVWWAVPGLAADAGAEPAHGWAPDGIAVTLADGYDNPTRMQRAALVWDRWRWWEGRRWHLGTQLELSVGRWTHPDRAGPGADIGLTPVFRLQRDGRYAPFVEAAVGAHLLSTPHIGGREMSTSYQFGDLAGLGVRFGERGRAEIGYRIIHYSNAGIRRPNPGINFHMLRFGYWY